MLRFYILLLLVLPLYSYAQEEKSVMELGDEAFARQEYAVAASLYGKLADKRKPSLTVLDKTAKCYVEMSRFEEAGFYYQKMLERDDCPSYINALFGEKKMNIGAYDTARKYIALYRTSNTESLQWKNRLLAGCDSAMIWEKRVMAVENIKELSTTGADYISGVVKDGLLLVSNGYRKMKLTTGSESHPKIDSRVNQPYFKPYIFKQYVKGSNANTYLEEVLPKLLGKLPYHVGPVCFNNREDTVYVTLNTQELSNKTKKGPLNGEHQMSLYWSFKKGDDWSELQPLPFNIAGSYTGNAVISGNILYFISDRPGSIGKTDIWYCVRQSDGRWGSPANCGAMINTPSEENFPTVNEPGMLYFSSKGHIGIGGFDIFRAAGSHATWSKPVNLGYPFNSGADDLGFIMKGNMYEGYFASNRVGGSGGDDVYHFMETHFEEKQPQPDKPASPAPSISEKPPVSKPTPPPPSTLSPEDSATIAKLQELCFYYDYNSAILLTTSREVLDRVAMVLKQHPYWKLMVRSYTDSRGSDKYNVDLSAFRCYAVIDYLIKQGISPRSLYYENMGEKDLVNPCGDGVPCSEDEHRKNRRTMLKVIH